MNVSKNMNSIIFNLAGGGVLMTVVGYMAVSYFTTPSILPCTERFPAGVQMGFDAPNGKLLTPIELQGRTGAREWGLLKNATVVAEKSIRASALAVNLAATGDDEKGVQNGVGFTWQPHQIAKAGAACLSYSVRMPDGFKFQEPGFLPGLFGASDVTQIDDPQPDDAFALRVGWAQAGDIGVDVRNPSSAGYWENPRRKVIWPTTRWTKIEQEVRLNSPGKDDGYMRVWVDGALTIDRGGLTLRKSPQSVLSGVIADIGYARTLSDVASIRVSPLTVQWQ